MPLLWYFKPVVDEAEINTLKDGEGVVVGDVGRGQQEN
jgi:hypothetical protein